MAYEKPVLDDFREKYHEDARKVNFGDARMRQIRCQYLDAFVRDVRQTLDEVGKRKGKRLELSAWIRPPFPAWSLDGGMDVQHWMAQGWLDSVIQFGGSPDPALIAAAKANRCQCIFGSEHDASASVGDQVAKRWVSGYGAGVDGFAVWDINNFQDWPTAWPVMRRAGHRKEIEAAAQAAPTPLTTVRLKTISGFDVMQALREPAYSGG